jgi:L-lactate permease
VNIRTGIPIWPYLVVAAGIAVTAYGIAQVVSGGGIPFVMVANLVWMAFSVSYQRKWHPKHG